MLSPFYAGVIRANRLLIRKHAYTKLGRAYEVRRSLTFLTSTLKV